MLQNRFTTGVKMGRFNLHHGALIKAIRYKNIYNIKKFSILFKDELKTVKESARRARKSSRIAGLKRANYVISGSEDSDNTGLFDLLNRFSKLEI